MGAIRGGDGGKCEPLLLPSRLFLLFGPMPCVHDQGTRSPSPPRLPALFICAWVCSSIGRIVLPKGLLRSSSGSPMIQSGMARPTRKRAASSAKLLQLWLLENQVREGKRRKKRRWRQQERNRSETEWLYQRNYSIVGSETERRRQREEEERRRESNDEERKGKGRNKRTVMEKNKAGRNKETKENSRMKEDRMKRLLCWPYQPSDSITILFLRQRRILC